MPFSWNGAYAALTHLVNVQGASNKPQPATTVRVSGLFHVEVSSATKSGIMGRLFLTVIGLGGRKNPENRDSF